MCPPKIGGHYLPIPGLSRWRGWTHTFELHEASHRSESFQPLFRQVLELCQNGNEEIAYRMLWSGKAYTPEEAREARAAKEKYAAVA
jgi:hypothetical protein